MAICGAAGPASNLVLAAVFTGLLKISSEVLLRLNYSSETTAMIVYFFLVFLYYGIQLNITLAVFNLLPVPPLDGSRIFYVFLPPKVYFGVMKYERYISLAIMVLLMLGVLSPVLNFISSHLINLLFRIFSIHLFGI